MRRTLKYILIGSGLVAAGGYFFLQGKAESNKAPRNPVQVVKTGLAEKKSIPITVNANGYVAALDAVEVHPQVQNVVRAVHVTEGQEVRAGQLLFTLDERSDTSNVEKARAQLARDRADLAEAEMALRRNQELLAKGFVSQAVVDSARNKLESAQSTLRADQAAIQSSNVALGYNQIRASIGGRLGAISVHPGSLVQPSGAPMVTIAQLDPIGVTFSLPERELKYILTTYPKGDAPVQAQDGGAVQQGRLVFIDNTADTQSGTIRMKAQFANPSRQMWPGTYVNISLVSRTLPDAVVVPAQAVVTGPTEKFVYVVQPDDKVKIQTVDVVAIEGEQAVVAGLNAGARIVVEGSQNLRPGSQVKEVQTAPEGGKQGKKKP